MSKNFSYTYLLPLLSEQVDLKKTILTFVTNTYVTTNKDTELGKFYIICKFNYSDLNFSKLEDILISNDLFITSYDIGEQVLYEFKFPDVYKFEQRMFIQGKYSQFEDDSKKLILKFWSELYGHIPSFVSNTLSKIRQILNKDNKLRVKMNRELNINIEKGSELGNKVDVKEETFEFPKEKEKINLNNIKDIFN